ncbi:MAG: 2-oxo acid dehydrogenase subunit E2 [Deltaproteobacteria bacterium]|nr:2-oxo acid dehydrogenase subunit E2 [Deltaproteobacteria bacterium]
MATEVIIPSLGEVVEDVTILSWSKSEGDSVQEGEPLLEVESEKVTLEIEAPASGVLVKILSPKGSRVRITEVVAVIAAEGEDVPEGYERGPEASKATETALPEKVSTSDRRPDHIKAAPLARKIAEQHGIDLALVEPTGPHGTVMKKDVEAYLSSTPKEEKAPVTGEKIKASPLARAMAASEGLNLAEIKGTGSGGRITKDDILRKLGEKEVIAEKDESLEKMVDKDFLGKEILETIPISGIRRAIYENMHMSLSQTAQLTLHTELCAEALIDLRDRLNEKLDKEGVKFSYNAILVKIVATALRLHPKINASVEGDEIKIWQQVHIGVAMESENGLIVPVIRNPDLKSITEINRELNELIIKTRENRLLPDNLANGTFTISNLGFADIDYFTPILRPPESAILGVGRIVEKPVIKDGKIIPDIRIGLSLTFDHRIIDGAPAARFLKTVKDIVENPLLMIS